MHDRSDLLAASPVGPAGNAVIFVIDGAGPGDLTGTSTPVLDDLARRGVTYRNAWVGQLESGGPTSNATIATGAFPHHQGVLGRQWHGTGRGVVQHASDPQQVQLGALDSVMEGRGTAPLAELLKNRSGRARILSAGGAGCADANAAGSWLADYIICPVRRADRWMPGSVTGHPLPRDLSLADLAQPAAHGRSGAPALEGWRLGAQDDWITRYTIRAMRRTKPVLTIVNFPEIRAVVPYLDPERRAGVTGSLMAGIDRDIGRVIREVRRERVANRTVFIVTSDAAIGDLSTRISAAGLDKAVVAAGGEQTFLDPGQTTMLGLAGDLQSQPVAQGIQTEGPRGLDGLYYKNRTGQSLTYQPQYLDPELSASFSATISYELSTMTSSGSADVVAVGAPGYGTAPRDGSYVGNGSSLGAQWDVQHIPLLLVGHGIVSGGVSSYPARLVDLAPTVAALMGLTAPPDDGLVLADGLQQPPSEAKGAQREEAPRQLGFVNALKARLARSNS